MALEGPLPITPFPSCYAVNGTLKHMIIVRPTRELFLLQGRPSLTLSNHEASNKQSLCCNCSAQLTADTLIIGPLWEIWNRRSDSGLKVCVYNLFLP